NLNKSTGNILYFPSIPFRYFLSDALGLCIDLFCYITCFTSQNTAPAFTACIMNLMFQITQLLLQIPYNLYFFGTSGQNKSLQKFCIGSNTCCSYFYGINLYSLTQQRTKFINIDMSSTICND